MSPMVWPKETQSLVPGLVPCSCDHLGLGPQPSSHLLGPGVLGA